MELEIPYTSLFSLPFLSFFSFHFIVSGIRFRFSFLSCVVHYTTLNDHTTILCTNVYVSYYDSMYVCTKVSLQFLFSQARKPDLVLCPFLKGLLSPFHSSHSCMDSFQRVSIFPTMGSQGYEQPYRCCPMSFSIIEKI